MDKNTFNRLLDHPESLTPDEWDDLHRERDAYPSCAPLQILSLIADRDNGAALWQKMVLPRVSLYYQDPSLLDRLLAPSTQTLRSDQSGSSLDEHTPLPPTEDIDPEPPMVQFEPLSDEPNDTFDILQAINSYQDVSFKTAPKSVILSNFLEKDAGIKLSDVPQEEIPVQDLAKKSIQTNNSLISETLAIILEKQGKIDQAISMYEKLILINPEKNSTFAVRIAELKTQLSEVNNK